MRVLLGAWAWVGISVGLLGFATAQEPAGDQAAGCVAIPSVPAVAPGPLELLEPRVYRLRVATRIEAPDGPITNVIAVAPFPLEWPEQKLKLLSERITPGAKLTEQVIKGQAGIMKLAIGSIAQGESAGIERLYEVTRYRLRFTLPPEDLRVARVLPAELREQLTSAAPGIEMTDPKMINLATTFRQPDLAPWDQVKSIWRWTRDNVKFQNGDFRGALFAIEQRCGDCEEMSALFIGLCRLNGLQARTVWVEGHDYPEFYLSDKKGKGHWIPAQVVGPEWFGEMTEYRPIFQKGDRFYDPFQKQYVRYVPHTVKADGKASPKLVVEHEIIADSDINGPTYNNPR